ncbi:MAG: carboxypeptidase regulatory-like domain-containing protein [Planctomycetes bacterium]|nr:carboxypeptidase regulatory-like domain-containing protein [Planctomycetota bacterium]
MKRLCTAIAGTFLTIGLIVGSSSTVKSYAYTEIEVTDGGNITGTVTLEGDIPPVKMLNVDSDTHLCVHTHGKTPSQALIVSKDTNGIKNVVVSIENIEKGKKLAPSNSNPELNQKGCEEKGGEKGPSNSNPALNQKDCEFIPHILVVPAGSKIDILNEDEVLHNVHTYAIKNSPINIAVLYGSKVCKRFMFPEIVRVKCDVHKWMSAYIVVKDNPYFAVTDENGNFKIDNVPAGTYKLQAWQETLENQVKDVTVAAGNEVKIDFKFTATK